MHLIACISRNNWSFDLLFQFSTYIYLQLASFLISILIVGKVFLDIIGHINEMRLIAELVEAYQFRIWKPPGFKNSASKLLKVQVNCNLELLIAGLVNKNFSCLIIKSQYVNMLNIWGESDIFKAPTIWAKVGIQMIKNCWYKACAKIKKRFSVSTAKISSWML